MERDWKPPHSSPSTSQGPPPHSSNPTETKRGQFAAPQSLPPAPQIPHQYQHYYNPPLQPPTRLAPQTNLVPGGLYRPPQFAHPAQFENQPPWGTNTAQRYNQAILASTNAWGNNYPGTGPSSFHPPASRKRPALGIDPMGRDGSSKRSNPGTPASTSPLGPAGSSSNIIDLTGDSPLRPAPARSVASRRPSTPSNIVLPPWQPDTDVSNCPICDAEFTFLYRKHHCRKCGRVVCDACSRHRISMPKKYIVQPPTNAGASPFSVVPGLENVGRPQTASDLFATVRVCNPCIPDPNYSPPPQSLTMRAPRRLSARHTAYLQQQALMGQQGSTSTSNLAYQGQPMPRGAVGQDYGPGLPQPGGPSFGGLPQFSAVGQAMPQRDRGTSSQLNMQPHHRRNFTADALFTGPSQAGSLFNSADMYPFPTQQRQHSHSHSHSYSGAQSSHALSPAQPISHSASHVRPRYGMRVPEHVHRPNSSSTSALPQPPPRREIAEEDECPVCYRELPPRNPADADAARAAHIDSCIAVNIGSFRPARTSSMVAWSGSQASSSALALASEPAALPPPQREQPLLEYLATEKDCADSEGQPVECVICFSEFEPGDEMGRLGCFCKFHKVCIRQWWSAKGKASCPTHQLTTDD